MYNQDKNCKCCKCCKHDICDITSDCSFKGVRPAIVDKPYPEIKVKCKNKCYADILSEDFTGKVSELTAITQYINHEIRISQDFCDAARTLLSISQAEMIHLQRLGELIILLGEESCGPLKFDACCNCESTTWTPNYIAYERCARDMITSDLQGEYEAIEQYKKHICQIDDPFIQANLERIIEDEKYHVELLLELLNKLDNKCDNC